MKSLVYSPSVSPSADCVKQFEEKVRWEQVCSEKTMMRQFSVLLLNWTLMLITAISFHTHFQAMAAMADNQSVLV